MFAELVGADALEQNLRALPADLLARLAAKAQALAEVLAGKVRDEKLSGEALASRSGALKASIAAEVAQGAGGLTATVGSFGDVKYAAIQEYGGRTSAHEILPDKAQALAFVAGGGMRFARRVQHPGSEIPARPYLSSALQDSYDDIVAGLTDAVQEAWAP